MRGVLKGKNFGKYVLGNKSILKTDIQIVVFVNQLPDKDIWELHKTWDVSEDGDGSIIAWVNEGVLHICGEGGVLANEDSSSLFFCYSNLKTCLFLENFHTERATTMKSMFAGCENLTKLDCSAWNTEHVTDMSFMFAKCRSLKELDISNFHTSNVTTM